MVHRINLGVGIFCCFVMLVLCIICCVPIKFFRGVTSRKNRFHIVFLCNSHGTKLPDACEGGAGGPGSIML